MANAHDYFDYLTNQIEISPANSQEELNAAQTISELMGEHGLETEVEEFDAPSFARLPLSILLIVLFIGTFIAGIGSVPLAVAGMLLALASTAVLVLDYLGNNLFKSVGPAARSQNVVAMHEASGPLVAKGNRPIVVMAHYDSPRESFLYSTAIAKYLPAMRKYAPWCVVAAGVSAFFQILLFLPEAARRVFWVIGFLAAIVPLILGIGALVERFSSCSLGANDNKSGVAAMLGVLEAVFPAGSSEGLVGRIAQKRQEAEAEDAPVRHGEEALRSLGILPESCEIEYVDEPGGQIPAAAVTGDIFEAGATSNLDDLPADDAGATAVTAPSSTVVESDVAAADGAGAYRPQVADVARRAALFDLPDPSAASSDPFATGPVPAVPEPRSVRSTLASRLSFADEQNARMTQSGLGSFGAVDDEADGLDVPVPGFEDAEEAPVQEEKPARKRFSLFGRKGREDEGSLSDYLGVDDDYDARSAGSEIGSWEELEAQDNEIARRGNPRWKGGAAVSEELRGADGEPTGAEKVEASASLGRSELLCHDIWFVALGANGLDHAGVKAFIAKHRPQLRGAFIINLDSVGAGDLAVLSNEGLAGTRRVDRRVNRVLKGVANDFGIDLVEVPFDWSSTDATPAMRSSMRAATIMGVNEMGLPALSRTPDDVPENVDPEQIARVASMVTEFIRRS